MRLLLRAGLALGFTVMAVSACKESAAPADFDNPTDVSADLSSVESTFDSDVFRSFSAAALVVDAAAPSAMNPVSAALQATKPAFERTGGKVALSGIRQGQRLQSLMPAFSRAAVEGRIIPDSMYGRVFEWDATLDQYTYQDSVIPGLNGVRFVLYAVGLDGVVVEPASSIGSFDIIDQSTLSTLQMQVLVKGPGGTPSYVDYTITVNPGQTSSTVSAQGSISNGLAPGANKTLTFNETVTVNSGGIRVNATFALNNPTMTLTFAEGLTFNDPNLVITTDFSMTQPGETIRTVGRITLNLNTEAITVSVHVYVNGHPVASIDGDPTDAGVAWVDAGGQPLTAADLEALDHLFDVMEQFQMAVENLFLPAGTLVAL
jgi:hypothetical protein